ncbi:peptidoglycan DD-metalloendopeptidase family protein [Aquimarina gracilis]|uniref:Peptidoglycan DD-metalloendopeptidase family protein n=1 Tax=Aquimarina gracilis TaxID=874422 RepID=A0ABU5ZSB0_9FLAO|nr:peptidoglycan DD-metalloendopeptidase family protein [Aquimarina gracilis]MEB3344538.1 peptidoglycan DD-metalloendopeptidase family protein [Aquimarina gracilis]
MDTNQFAKILQELTSDFTPVISSTFLKEDYLAIDLSEDNRALDQIDVASSEAFEVYISNYLRENEKKVAYGGYNEVRGIYRRSSHFNKQDAVTERNIHLGIDVWCDAGTEILAALDGEIHSFKNNDNYGDYGPTIILQHAFEGYIFYTLYGHLSLESIASLQIRQEVKKGQVIAKLGNASVNGDYAPHLHFQIIKDMQGNTGDYPGVSSKNDLKSYLQNCPDPNLLLKI